MIVQIRVLVNSDEIKDAKSKNDYYAKLREENKAIKHKDARKLVPEDVEIPADEIKISDMLIDAQDVLRARVNELGNISIVHLGQETQIVYSDEVWNQLKERFNVK